MDGIRANGLFQASAFSKGYNGKCAKGFLQLWFACNMCQCFVRISFKFGNAQLYVIDNGMQFIMTFLLVEQLFSIKLVNFLNLLYNNIVFVYFINKLFNKFLEWLW